MRIEFSMGGARQRGWSLTDYRNSDWAIQPYYERL